MKITEVFESMDITRDDKARRRLNIADDVVPNIDVHTLSKGVTIEQLESLNVPVLQYQTQITIHGKFRLGNVDLPTGLIWNNNQSLGVRYVLIDYEKKLKLKEISYLSKSNWKVTIDSQECIVWQRFDDKQAAIDCYNSIDTNLFIGRKDAVSLAYYGYAVIITINAIYEKDFWSFSEYLFDVTELKFEELQNAYEQKRILERNTFEQARVERSKQVEILKKTIEDMGYDLHTGKIKSGFYLHVNRITGELLLHHLKVTAKRITAHTKRINSVDEISVFDYSGKRGQFIDAKIIKGWYVVKLDQNDEPVVQLKQNNSEPDLCQDIRVEYSGTWTWIYFDSVPSTQKRYEMKQMGGLYSDRRKAWYFKKIVSKEQLEFLKG